MTHEVRGQLAKSKEMMENMSTPSQQNTSYHGKATIWHHFKSKFEFFSSSQSLHTPRNKQREGELTHFLSQSIKDWIPHWFSFLEYPGLAITLVFFLKVQMICKKRCTQLQKENTICVERALSPRKKPKSTSGLKAK
jgi:hypothetical protein